MIQDYRIAALVHSQLVADIVYGETLKLGWNIHVVVTSYDTALADAQTIFDQGYEVLLCHGGFREAVFRHHGRRTVVIERAAIDLIKALSRARELSTTVALTAHVHEALDIDFMQTLLNMRIVPVYYDEKDDLEQKIFSVMSTGVKVFVGGGGTGRIVNSHGGQVVLDEPQSINIRNAVNRAMSIAELLRMEQQHLTNIHAVFHCIKEGILCVGPDKELVFHNEQALNYLQAGAENQLSSFFSQLHLDRVLAGGAPCLDRLVNINGKHLLINTFPLTIAPNVNGAACFIHDVQSLQKINRKIGTDMQSRGLVPNYTVDDIIGNSNEIKNVKENILRYAPTDIPVYIHGETGTGKELVAHSLHAASKRAQKPFVVINCSALPDPLLESELFGYEEGAFTGAKKGGKEGLFEMADGGTLFLDEIGDVSHAVQLRLLRVLDAKEIMHVGGNRFIPINVRILCASHKNLLELVKTGAFRMDLYFRLVGVCVDVPPLRQRTQDIPVLLDTLLKRYHRTTPAFNTYIMQIMQKYQWPGNIRELMSVVESYLVLLGDKPACPKSFDEVFRNRHTLFSQPHEATALNEQVAAFRRGVIQKALEQHGGDRKKTAKVLDISYSSLRRILGGDEGVHD